MADDSVIGPIGALIRANDLTGAERRCRRALRDTPDHAELSVLLGYVLERQGRAADALAVFERLVGRFPDSSRHWGNYATALKRVGNMQAAERAADKAAMLTPDDPTRLEQLGLLRLATGKLAEARTALLRAHELAPDSAEVTIYAARACVACRDARADGLLQPWRGWLPLADDLQGELANVLVQANDSWAALELLEDLVRRVPDDWHSELLLAKVYERVNRVDEAMAKLRWIVAAGAAERDADVRREVALQEAHLATRRHDYALAHTRLQQAGPLGTEDYGWRFMLARVEDKLGNPAAVMAALADAHAGQVRELHASNPHLLEPGAPALPRVDDRVSADDRRAWPDLHAPDRDQSPIFVVGFPRSGTTLLEQMLDAHPGLQSMDERPFLNTLANRLEGIGIRLPRDLGKLTQRDCDELRKGYVLMACSKIPRRWDARLVDKNPLNLCWLPLLQRLFPDAQFILALRHPCDVILSCYLQNFSAAPLMAACRSLDALARAYVTAMQNWLYHAEVFKPNVLVSRYEDLVADAAGQTRTIAAFLGLDDAGPMLQFDQRARDKGFIGTPSYTEVIEPIHADSIGHWQRYRAHFEPLLPILAPLLDHWGYAARPEVADAALT